MLVGKVPNDILKSLILDKIVKKRKEVLVAPKIGEDCCAVDFGENACVISSDPITGAINEVGRLAVHISCNDVASCGVEPIGLLVTILAPEGTTERELGAVMEQINETANSLNVDIIGGHTEITNAVNRFVLVTTAIGKAQKENLITTSGAKHGDSIILTKTAGLEGTAIIAHDKEDELMAQFGVEFVKSAKRFVDLISVVKEGKIAGEFGVNSMHDVTEGGVLGALWEMAEASEVGITINKKDIPITVETQKICEHYKLNPLKLISSGCMLITCKNGDNLVDILQKNDIEACIIGKITELKDKKLITEEGVEDIKQPDVDELFKV